VSCNFCGIAATRRRSRVGTAIASIRAVRERLDRLEDRTKSFAIEVIKLCVQLERLPGLRQVAWQLTRAAGSVGSNHRAVRRARSAREFAAKLQIVNEEIDECVFGVKLRQPLTRRMSQY